MLSAATDDNAATAEDPVGLGHALSTWLPVSELRVVLGWTLLAFLLRLLLLATVEHVISPDGVQYVGMGQNLIAGNFREGLSTYWPPLYPLLVGLFSLVFRDAEFAGRFVSVVAGSLLVLPAHRLARRWYGRRVAFICAAVVAVHPLLIYYSTVLLTEATYTLLFTCGVLAGWSAITGGNTRAQVLAGATFGACYLLKPEAAGFVLLLLVAMVGAALFSRRLSFKRSLGNALLVCAGFLGVALPYLFYLRQATGGWMLTGKFGAHLWQGSRKTGEIGPLVTTLVPDLTTAVVQITKALRYEYEVFNLIFPLPFVLIAGLGLFRTRWTRVRAARELYLFLFVAAALAGYAVTLPNIRFVVPLLPILLCWLAHGVVEFEEWLVETLARVNGAGKLLVRGRRLVVPLVVAALLVSLLPLFVYLLRGDKWSDYHGQKSAAAWIKKQNADGAAPVIMSTVPVAAFYAGGRHVLLIDQTPAELVERARREQARYVIINERNLKHMSLRTLLDEQNQYPGLRLAQRTAESPGHRILVYELTGAEQATPQEAPGQKPDR